MNQQPQQQPQGYSSLGTIGREQPTSQGSQVGQRQFGQPQFEQSQFGQPESGASQSISAVGNHPNTGHQQVGQVNPGQPSQSASQSPPASGTFQSTSQTQSPQTGIEQNGQQIASVLQELERVLDRANGHALRNGNPRLARMTEDLGEMTETERKLILRESPYAESFRQAVVGSLQQAVQELRQQPTEDPTVQEVITRVQQAAEALQNGSVEIGQQPQQLSW
ncbi:hypothetical protein Hbl1158_15965 (plasmid) [Halobaculum sp. CBA1158]|uniref:hypothetical protein n=1 Tax=Halobaculum sp. CBA1158 TaxID=2904243 RepID=UPI001F282378|nr:hypothetical protein [Halobaculum sp. CBA1158]UIP01403.1 hypothetical protein Hbl1158_15965 [Halobaculum sp. CBA1158]